MVGGLPWKTFVFIEFEDGGGILEFSALALEAVGLNLAKLVEGFLELAGEPMALQVEVCDEAMGVDDVEVDTRLLIGRVGGAGEQVGLEQRDAIEAPGGVDQFLDELGFGRSCRLVFVHELAALRFVGGWIFRRQDRGSGGQAAWRRALSDARCLPASVRGPVECWAFARLMTARSMVRSKAGTRSADMWSPQLGLNTGAGLRSAAAGGSD